MVKDKNYFENNSGYWELNLITREFLFSEELKRLIYPVSEDDNLSFDSFLKFVNDEDRKSLIQLFELPLTNQKIFSIDFRITNHNNAAQHLCFKGEVKTNDKNQPIKISGFGFDISVQKNNERKLEAQIQIIQILSSAKILNEVVQNILKIICESTNWLIGELWLPDYSANLLNLEGNWSSPNINADEFIEVSKRCKFGFGVSLQGRVWESGEASWSSNIVDDQFFPRTNLAAKLNLKTALAFPIKSLNKILGIMAFYKNNIFEPDNEFLNMLDFIGSQIGDFIEREKNEPTFHESEGLYKTLVEISPDAITYTDLSGKILFCNQQAAELFEFNSVEELIEQNIYAFTAPEDQNNAIRNENATIELGKTKNIEYTLLKRNGARFNAEVNTSIVRDVSGKPKAFIGVIRDITKRKLAEEEIKIRIEQQAKIAEFGQFALAGHDVRKIMNRAIEILVNTLKVEFCELLELLPDDKTLLLTAGYGWKKGSMMKTKLNSGIDSHAGFTLLSDEPIVVENFYSEKRFKASKLLKDHKVISGITVVIKGKNKPFGILGLHSTKPRLFTKNDSHFLQAAANILAMGIERKNVEDELAKSLKISKQLQLQAEESKNRLQLLSEASIILNSSLNYFQTITNVANQIVPSIADLCIIDLIEREEVRNIIVSNPELSSKVEIKNLERTIANDFYSNIRITKILELNESKLFNQIDDLIYYWNVQEIELLNIIKNLKFNSAEIIPIRIRGRIIGSINLLSCKNNFNYAAADIKFIEDMARRMSTAIETSRLFGESKLLNEKLNRKAKERTEELEISNTELEVEIKLRKNIIKDYNDLVAQQSGILELLQKSEIEANQMQFMHELILLVPRVLHNEYCGIFEFQAENKKFILRAGIGWNPTDVGSLKIDVKPEFQEGYILLNNENLIVENYESNNKFILHQSLYNNNVKIGLSVLIKNKNKNYGVLSIYSVKNNNFTHDEIRFIKVISYILTKVLEK